MGSTDGQLMELPLSELMYTGTTSQGHSLLYVFR